MSRAAVKRPRTARPPEPASLDAREIQDVHQRVNLALNAIRWIRWHSAGLVHAADELHQFLQDARQRALDRHPARAKPRKART
jgi:hypothetical protein